MLYNMEDNNTMRTFKHKKLNIDWKCHCTANYSLDINWIDSSGSMYMEWDDRIPTMKRRFLIFSSEHRCKKCHTSWRLVEQ